MTRKEAWDNVKLAVIAEDPESTLTALGEYFKLDAEQTKHPTVKSLLEGLSEDCKILSFNYYASTK